MNSHSLIDRIKNHDADEALREIFNAYRNEFMLWAVRNHSCTMEEAKEVFQESVVILYENIIYEKVTEITTQVKTYLFSIGKNKIRELLRLKARHQTAEQDHLFQDQDIYHNRFDEAYEEKLKKVETEIEKLGDPCRKILTLYYYHRKSMQDIADLMNYKNSDTVKNLKYKCLQRLKQTLGRQMRTFLLLVL